MGAVFTTDAAVPVSVGRLSRYKITGTGSHTLEIIKASTLATVASVISSNDGTPDNSAVEGVLSAKVQLELNTKYYLVSSEASGGDPWRDYSGTAARAFRVSDVNPVSHNGSTWTEIVASGPSYGWLAFKA